MTVKWFEVAGVKLGGLCATQISTIANAAKTVLSNFGCMLNEVAWVIEAERRKDKEEIEVCLVNETELLKCDCNRGRGEGVSYMRDKMEKHR